MNGACVDGEPPLLAAAALATDASCMCQTTATPQRAIKSKRAIQQALLSRSSTRQQSLTSELQQHDVQLRKLFCIVILLLQLYIIITIVCVQVI
jgi:hypothetical protein